MIAVRSTRPVSVTGLLGEAAAVRVGLNLYCDSIGETRELFPGLLYTLVKDHGGAIMRFSNATDCLWVEVNTDADDSVGLVSSRGGGLITHDLLPPKTSMIVAVLSPQTGSVRYRLAVSINSVRHSSPPGMDSSVPPVELTDDAPPILAIHQKSPVEGKSSTVQELITRVTDPHGMSVLLQVVMNQQRREANVQRLCREFIHAGIDPDEAIEIAREEAANSD